MISLAFTGLTAALNPVLFVTGLLGTALGTVLGLVGTATGLLGTVTGLAGSLGGLSL